MPLSKAARTCPCCGYPQQDDPAVCAECGLPLSPESTRALRRRGRERVQLAGFLLALSCVLYAFGAFAYFDPESSDPPLLATACLVLAFWCLVDLAYVVVRRRSLALMRNTRRLVLLCLPVALLAMLAVPAYLLSGGDGGSSRGIPSLPGTGR